MMKYVHRFFVFHTDKTSHVERLLASVDAKFVDSDKHSCGVKRVTPLSACPIQQFLFSTVIYIFIFIYYTNINLYGTH